MLGVVAGVVGVVLVLVVVAVIITLRSRRPRSSTPTKSTHLPSGEASEEGLGLDHPDLLEAKAHVGPPAPCRAAEVTQAVSGPRARALSRAPGRGRALRRGLGPSAVLVADVL